MRRSKKPVAAVLLASMLLSLCSGFASAAGEWRATTVTTDSELVYAPLAETASIAYERHEDGYAVSLDRAPDSVTMSITAVPEDEDSRGAEKARLYIHTGVALKADTAYQVSFSLSAEQAQPEYAVCFDGNSEGAYGMLEGRSIEAGGTDQVEYLITPEQESGELVLRLLLGKTGGNTFRFSDLAVGEAPEGEAGENVVLVDDLDYNAPGFIRLGLNGDSKAVITSDEKSATLTVTQAPTEGAEVWKIKLLVATGLKPEPGKTYHFQADLTASTAGEYEICYNEGDVEKGYDVLYSQKLMSGKQTVERRIYIPTDKENPGELVVQFSLGKLKTGDKVTISNVKVEEEIPRYTNALAKDFAFNKTHTYTAYSDSTIVTGATQIPATVNWNGESGVTASGDHIGALTTSGNSATLEIKGGTVLWDARFNIDTGLTLSGGKSYQVSFKVCADKAYSEYEVLYGTALNGVDNNQAYGFRKGLTLAADTTDTINYTVNPNADGPLLISLQVGKTNGEDNAVTVSDFTIQEMTVQPVGESIAVVNYPSVEEEDGDEEEETEPTFNPGSFGMREDNGQYRGTISDGKDADGLDAVIVTCEDTKVDPYQRGLFINNICTLEAGKSYLVSFDISADEEFEYNVCYNCNEHFGNGEKAFGMRGGLTTSSTKETVTQIITPVVDKAGKLFINLEIGKANAGTQITVSNIKVEEIIADNDIVVSNENKAEVTYQKEGDSGEGPQEPSSEPVYSAGSFSLRDHENDHRGSITGSSSNSVTVTCAGTATGSWMRGLYINNICTLGANESYLVSFDIRADEEFNYNVCYNKDGTEKGFGARYDLTMSTQQSETIEKIITTGDMDGHKGGGLTLYIELGNATADTEVTVSNVKVEKIQSAVTDGDNKATMNYNDDGSFGTRASEGDPSSLSFGEDSVTMTLNGSPTGAWARGLHIDGCDLTAGKSYLVSFDIKANQGGFTYSVCYNKDGRLSNEKVFGAKYGRDMPLVEDTVEHIIAPAQDGDAGKLFIFLELGLAPDGTEVTVSNVKVEEITSVTSDNNDLANVSYPEINSGGGSAGSDPESTIELGSFSLREDWGKHRGTLAAGKDGDQDAVIVTCEDTADGPWQRGLFINNICTLEAGKSYLVSFDISADEEFEYNVCYNRNEHFGNGEKAFGMRGGLTTSSTKETVTQIITPVVDKAGKLFINLEIGNASAGTRITVSNVKVQEITGVTPTGENKANVTYPSGGSGIGGSGSGSTSGTGSFAPRDEGKGTISTRDGKSATITCAAPEANPEAWQRGMLTGQVALLEAGKSYQVSLKVEADRPTDFEVCYNKDRDWNPPGESGYEKGFGGEYGLRATTEPITVIHTVTADDDKDNKLSLRIDLGLAEEGAQVTVSDIEVLELSYAPNGSPITINGFGAVSADAGDGYAVDLTKNAANAVLKVTKTDLNTEVATWKAKLHIPTDLVYEAGKSYRVKFDITAEKACNNFCVIFQGVSDSEDIRGTWEQTVNAGQTKTITTRGLPAGKGSGTLGIDIELGIFDGTENTFTVSNLKVEEVQVTSAVQESKTEGTVTVDAQEGYRAQVTRKKDSGTVRIEETPDEGMEAWKTKMFVNTDVQVKTGDALRVIFDVEAEKDLDFEVCYNRDNQEKGFAAVYGLHLAAGQTKTLEKVITAENPGTLKLQLSLGMVKAPNAVTVKNLKVERIDYTRSGRSALPAEADYRAPSAITYWAHEDYTVAPTGTDDAITMNITEAPQVGAEPWKIKLFIDTATVLQPGKYYKVTTDLTARMSQDFEICYNNGGVEMGYDSLGGLHLEGGKTQTVERIVAVPADKTDATNLMLQVNLGKTNVANSVTVSGVTVEEVSLAYAEMMPKDFTYTVGSTVNLWTNTDYTAAVDGSDDTATVHITDVPSAGAEVWKVQMLVSTGAVLSPGKTYIVRADLLATRTQNYEICYNNEETEKGYDALYGQTIYGGYLTTVERKISVPASMTDAGELILQFAVGGSVTNDITISGISVQELNFGASGGNSAPDTVINVRNAAGTLDFTREKLTYKLAEGGENAITVAGANLRANELYTVTFTAKADKELSGTFSLYQPSGAAVIWEGFQLTGEEATYSFTTKERLVVGGAYDLFWQFDSADNGELDGAGVEISNISVYSPAETLEIWRSIQNVTVNGKTVMPDMYAINGYNYFKLRDLAMLLNDTDAQFVVRYNGKTNSISLTTGKPYTPVGGELVIGEDMSASCIRCAQSITVNGEKVDLKAYSIGGYNFFRIRDLNELLGFKLDYIVESDTVAIASPRTPEAQEKAHEYNTFFLPEIDGESQAYVGDTMPYYEDGVYYVYYLKEGGDSYNHSVYLATTEDFVSYTELDGPVLSASREDVQDSWIGTGSVVKVDNTYYFFYTGFNSSGSQEYHEKIMVAKSDNLTSFEKVRGWEIVPPAELGQKNDFRDPQAYYDPETQTISLTVTASQGGMARILKYTLGKDLQNVKYDGIIFTDPTGRYWNLECSDTFQIGDKWYLTYSGQDDTLWYASADSRFGPYSAPARLDGKIFYAAKHVEDGTNSYMVGWARRSNSASSTSEVSGWAGNLAVQQLRQQPDGSLTLVPVDSIVSSFDTQKELVLGTSGATVTAGAERSYQAAFTSEESFMLSGEFTCSGTGAFGLAFDFNGKEDQYKLISIDPAASKLSLAFNGGATPVAETAVTLDPNQAHSFTYIQDGSVGIFYLDGQASLTVRLYGVTDKPIYLFAENNSVTFTSLMECTQ